MIFKKNNAQHELHELIVVSCIFHLQIVIIHLFGRVVFLNTNDIIKKYIFFRQ